MKHTAFVHEYNKPVKRPLDTLDKYKYVLANDPEQQKKNC